MLLVNPAVVRVVVSQVIVLVQTEQTVSGHATALVAVTAGADVVTPVADGELKRVQTGAEVFNGNNVMPARVVTLTPGAVGAHVVIKHVARVLKPEPTGAELFKPNHVL